MDPTPDPPDTPSASGRSPSVFTTLRRLQRLGPVPPQPGVPRDLEGLTGLSGERVAALAPWLRAFRHGGRCVIYAGLPADGPNDPEASLRFHYLRRCLANAIQFGHGRWPELRDVFSSDVVELVEALVPTNSQNAWRSQTAREWNRHTKRALAERIAKSHLRRTLGVSMEVDDGPPCVAAILLLHDALSSAQTTSRVLTRLALVPVGGDHCATALDGLRLAGLVSDENRNALSRLLRASSGRVRIAAARALTGPRAESVLAHALTERRKKPDIPVRAAAALLEIAPQHPCIPDALELLVHALHERTVWRVALEALRHSRHVEVAATLERLASWSASPEHLPRDELLAAAARVRSRSLEP